MEWIIEGSADAEYVSGLLELGGSQAQNTDIIMGKIVKHMMLASRRQINSQGRRGGGSWKALKPDTVRKKGAHVILRTIGARPGYSKIDGEDSTDSLFRSLTEFGAPYQILEVTKNTIRFGTDRPYAGVHQHGSWLRHIPARPFLKILPVDESRYSRLIAEHLMKPFIRGKSETGPGANI